MTSQRKLKRYVGRLIRRNRENKDSVILVTGSEGSGKSHFAIMLAHMLDPLFRIEKIIFYDVQEFWRQVRDPDKYRVIMCDEAAEFLTSQDWMKSESKAITDELKLCRYKRKYFIFCVPSKEDTHFYVRDHRAKFWVYVHEERGKADLGVSYRSKWKRSLYWEDKNYGTTRYPPLPAHMEARYDRKKEQEKKWVEENPLAFSANHIHLLLTNGLLDGREVSDKASAKAHAYLALEKNFPYSKIPGQNLTMAINAWWSGRNG